MVKLKAFIISIVLVLITLLILNELVFMELALQLGFQQLYHDTIKCHNPCFYGISFAINGGERIPRSFLGSQSLFLWN